MWHIQSESYKVKSKLGIVGVLLLFFKKETMGFVKQEERGVGKMLKRC